jgi:hypothetical protein
MLTVTPVIDSTHNLKLAFEVLKPGFILLKLRAKVIIFVLKPADFVTEVCEVFHMVVIGLIINCMGKVYVGCWSMLYIF